MSSKAIVSLPRPIEALSLAYHSCTSSLNGIEPIIVTSTNDGRLFHSNSIMDMKTSDIKMMECKRETYTQNGEVRKIVGNDPFLLGMDIFAVKIDDRNPMYRKPTTIEDEELSRGLTMIVSGSSTLNPPTVVHIPFSSISRKNINEDPVSLVKIVEITGLEEMDSVICSILFLDESILENKIWKGLLNLCSNDVITEIENSFVRVIRTGVVLMGFEDGSVYCTFISETIANIGNSCTPDYGLTDIIQLSTACKIYQMTSPAQPVNSIMLVPSFSTSCKSSASENNKIVCMGALGGISILVPKEEGVGFIEVLVFPTAPYTTKFGVLMDAAPFLFTHQCLEPELKIADIDQRLYNKDVGIHCYPFELKNKALSLPCSFIATSDDGSSYHISIQCNQNASAQNRGNEESGKNCFLTGKFTKLPIRREMSCVVSCWIPPSSKQCSFPHEGQTFLALSTFRNGLCLMITRLDKRLERNVRSALVSIISHKQSPEKYVKNSELHTTIKNKGLNSTKHLLQTLHNILEGDKVQLINKIGKSSSDRVSLEHRSTRHAATVVSSNLKYDSDDNKFKAGNKLISFELIEKSGDALLVKEREPTPLTEWSNENYLTRTCHVIQNTTHGTTAKIDGPSLNDLHVLCSRQIVKGMGRIRAKIYFGGTSHSISRQRATTSTAKPLQMRIPFCDKFPISAFLSTSMQYNDGKSPLSTGMKIVSQQIQQKSSYSGQKRRGVGATLGVNDRSVLKRAKVLREINFSSVSCHKSTTIGSLGIVLPPSQNGTKHSISDWDLLDSLASFEKNKEITIAPQSSILTMQSFLRRVDYPFSGTSPSPNDRENMMIQTYTQSNHTLGKTRRDYFITSEFIGLRCPDILRGVIFPKESTRMIGGPLVGVKAIGAFLSVKVIRESESESESAQDNKRGVDFSIAGDFNQNFADTVTILQSSLKKKMAHHYMIIGDRNDSDSESDVAKVVDAYKRALQDPRKKKGLQYLKQKALSVSQSRISAAAAIELHQKMRYLQVPIG